MPAEVVFDQGLGDLFVIRVAGTIVAPSQIGSVEFAAARFGTRLVVVMGHSGCGAITATIEDMRSPSKHSKNIRSIVDRVRPSVQPLLEVDIPALDYARLVDKAVRANVRASCLRATNCDTARSCWSSLPPKTGCWSSAPNIRSRPGT